MIIARHHTQTPNLGFLTWVKAIEATLNFRRMRHESSRDASKGWTYLSLLHNAHAVWLVAMNLFSAMRGFVRYLHYLGAYVAMTPMHPKGGVRSYYIRTSWIILDDDENRDRVKPEHHGTQIVKEQKNVIDDNESAMKGSSTHSELHFCCRQSGVSMMLMRCSILHTGSCGIDAN